MENICSTRSIVVLRVDYKGKGKKSNWYRARNTIISFLIHEFMEKFTSEEVHVS